MPSWRNAHVRPRTVRSPPDRHRAWATRPVDGLSNCVAGGGTVVGDLRHCPGRREPHKIVDRKRSDRPEVRRCGGWKVAGYGGARGAGGIRFRPARVRGVRAVLTRLLGVREGAVGAAMTDLTAGGLCRCGARSGRRLQPAGAVRVARWPRCCDRAAVALRSAARTPQVVGHGERGWAAREEQDSAL
jgi:hypothetical protein